MKRHLDALIAAGSYTDFAMRNSVITGTTKLIIIEYEGTQFEMGIYKVRVDVSSASVRFELVSSRQNRRALDDYIHPHISGDSACWGNVRAEVPRIIRRGEIGTLFELIMDFLTTYNPDGPYMPITDFPRHGRNSGPTPPPAPAPSRAGGQSASPSGTASTASSGNGFFSRLARRNPTALRAQESQTSSSTAEAHQVNAEARTTEMTVFNASVDRDLRARGVNPARLNSYERGKLRRLTRTRHGGGEYMRLLRYYVRWIRGRRR